MALSTQRASASFVLNESAPRWKYDVFLSFRGVDTRKGFVSHLYHELCNRQGITTFMDDRDLEGGTSIHLELPSAIKESHIAIVVLSPNYAFSKWCLNELTTILQCMESRNSILPVFYETDPSDVGNQRGRFAEAFAKHEENSSSTEDKKKVVQWKADLKRVSKICGWHSKEYKSESEIIQQLVKSVWRKVQATFPLLDSSRELVGVNFGLEQLSSLLAHDVNDVRFIGITGMGGIGKTTLAKLVYDRIFHHFDVHCFLENVREVSKTDPTLIGIQETLLSPMLKEKVLTQQGGICYTERCFRKKKVLLVLDDVDDIKQLQVLAGKEDWFGMGSRIIITTRNERLLVEHGITLCHNVKVLDKGAASVLFSLHAFKKNLPEDGFWELSTDFINYAGGLPLALKTLGSTLFKRGLHDWNSVRDNLSKVPNPTIFDKLKISYDGLEEMEKSIFLDVACLHKGKHREEIIELLDNSFGVSSSYMINVLIERSLLYQDHNKCIRMHDLIQEMAWTIISHNSKEPGQRSRLWIYNDIYHIFTMNTGTGAIEAISLRLPQVEEVRQWNFEAFSKMDGLRFLEFDNLIFPSGPKFLPCSLRIINWSFYPSSFLPTSFHPRFLAQLKMRESNLVRLWEGKVDLPYLKCIDLTDSNKLKSTPDFSGLPNLVDLILRNCKNLVEIHPSIAILKRLKHLFLSGCESIKSLPSEVEMDSLQSLDLVGCSNVKKIPEFGEQMKNLFTLDLSETAIEKIPSSIGHLVGLRELHVRNCKNLLNLPRAICNLKSLKHLQYGINYDAAACGSDGKAREGWGFLCLLGLGKSRPDPPPYWSSVLSFLNRLYSLTYLQLKNCNIQNCNIQEGDIPDDIGCLSFLEDLDLRGNNFVSLPESIRRLSKLRKLILVRCKSLQQLPPLPSQSESELEYDWTWTLDVHVDNCTSLRRFSDPSNLYGVWVTCLNCIALVPDEGWIKTILSGVVRYAPFAIRNAVIPASEIPEWFNNQNAGHSINVEVPPGDDLLELVICAVFQDPSQNLANPAALRHYDNFEIMCFGDPGISSNGVKYDIGSLVSEHLWIFSCPCALREDCHQKQLVFETFFDGELKADWNVVKKCGARLVYKQDLKELNRKLPKRTRENRDEATPWRLGFDKQMNFRPMRG